MFDTIRINSITAVTDAAIQNKMFGSGMTTLTTSNEKMDDFMKIVKSLEESGLLIKGVRETIKDEAKKQKVRFLSILLGTLGAGLLGNLLAGKQVIRACEGTTRAGQSV